ncbi:5-methyltetrahydropteroyltriglutamate--homocysteine S-methyltransferase [Peribacillus sp. B-H-3]|uniref:5-methyltetrahydropteroyltriglutamate-- homocysteine S-methyltransferase n=1 Tax=Peribacillus sp. B-H-3 TaxID=3400420 RepID=UPI003B01948D
MSKVKSSNLGYPRIGENREWKRVIERFWAGKLEQEDFLAQIEGIRLNHLCKQKEKGIDLIPVGDFSLYDHVLDTAMMFGLVPKRFEYSGGKVPLKTYFDIARGTKEAVASEMTKWFNTNYHYIVPELEDAVPALVDNRPLHFYREAKQKLDIEGKPVILGPVTFVKLSKGYNKDEFKTVIESFIPLYSEVLRELQEEGVQWIQIDEPILSTTLSKEEVALFHHVYARLHKAAPDIRVILQTYFEGIDHYEEVISLPVQGIGLDFVHDNGQNLTSIQMYGFPKDKVLAAGVINGRNIWRADLDKKFSLLKEIESYVSKEQLIIQPSSSLLHTPVTVKNEVGLEVILKEALSFADEKLSEVNILMKGIQNGKDSIQEEISSSQNAILLLNELSSKNRLEVNENMAKSQTLKIERKASFQERQIIQEKFFQLPLLPTTTIGSFPQTQAVKKHRLQCRKGEISNHQYDSFIKEEIHRWINIQEKIGLDVFVHGEFERTDMVEYFGEKLDGFQMTTLGWVQSYGSRCVKPPVIYGDVSYREPMTLKETLYAQSLTDKPVKGMLTGPVTILNWSFVREDIPRDEVANQIALTLQKEVEILERSGIHMIQVDEPALREGLPLKQVKWDDYLHAAVYAFKLATAFVKNETQIHTHMCYSNFEDIMDTIRALDADVISIETSRSHGELIQVFEENTYDKGIGLGVYDIHSPRVPEISEIRNHINRALKVLDSKQCWINPDCGLKTRGISETVEALKIMVEAAKQTRESLLVK